MYGAGLPLWTRKALKSFVLPGGVILLTIAVMAHSGWLAMTPPALSFLYYCFLIGAGLLSWRFHSGRTFLALLLLFIAEEAVALAGGGRAYPGTAGWTAIQSVALLLPLNFVLIAFAEERGFSAAGLAGPGMLFFVQMIVVTVLCRATEQVPATVRTHGVRAVLPTYAILVFGICTLILLVRWSLTRKPADCALFWSLLSFFLALKFLPVPRISLLYIVGAAAILGVSIIENSYLLAYHDELTTLPSRRAFNDAIVRLQDRYSIAVVDIDHFKRFNDTYGHDTGDQVLRLVASKLARVAGGGQAYRCGGEEFNILFPGKTVEQALSHLETLRLDIQAAEFRRRGDDRRQIPRGPDRRNEATRGRKGKAHAIRKLAQESAPSTLSVTVSIGVAEYTSQHSSPELVLEAADKALYRAKEGGRNRVEKDASARRSRTKAAGIA